MNRIRSGWAATAVLAVLAGACTTSTEGAPVLERVRSGERERWEATTGAWPFSIEADAAGPVVVIGAGEVVALSAADGSQMWRVEVAAAGSTAPAIGDGVAVVPTRMGVAALARETGEVLWERAFAAPVSGLAVRDGIVAVGAEDGTLTTLDAGDGATRFEVSYPGALRTPPRLAPDRGAIVATWHSEEASALRVLEWGDGSRRWEVPLAELSSGAAVAGELVVVGEGHGNGAARVIARHIVSGDPVWVQAWPAGFESGIEPVVADGAVTIVDRYGTVARYGAEAGERRWVTALRRPVLQTRLIEAGGSVFLTVFRGDVVRLDAGSGEVLHQERPDGYPAGIAVGPDLYVALRLVDPGNVEARPLH